MVEFFLLFVEVFIWSNFHHVLSITATQLDTAMSTHGLATAEDTTTLGDDVITPEPETNCGELYQVVTSGVVVGGLCVFGIIANGLTLGVLPRYARKSKGSSPTALMLAALVVTDSCLLLLLLILQSTPVYCNNVGTHINRTKTKWMPLLTPFVQQFIST